MSPHEQPHKSNDPPTDIPGKAHEHAARRDWPRFFKAVEGKGARETLLKAIALFEEEAASAEVSRAKRPPADPKAERFAIDLGCGSGRDTFELLKRGWRVFAVDGHPWGIELLTTKVATELGRLSAGLATAVATMEEFEVPPALLINASYALPFCAPAKFDDLWRRIVRALPPGGRFAGQFFGERDGWAGLPDRSHHTRMQVERLLEAFTIDQLQEVENYETGVTGEVKNWHIFHVVARKR